MNQVFGKKKLIKDISANTLQTGIVQFFGLAIFYFTSKYLGKNDFGELNWSLAVGSTMIAIGSLGLDLVYVKKVALGENILVISGIHFFHTLAVAIILCLGVVVVRHFFPSFSDAHPIFLLVFLHLALANIANSFKLCLNGVEAYNKLAVLALIINVVKFGLIWIIYVLGKFNITNIVLSYLSISFLELLIGFIMVKTKLSLIVKPVFDRIEYKFFIIESLPQLGVVLFDSALARIDWILLGIFSSTAVIADYSFTYRVFELSKLPLIVIAPILLTRFAKLVEPGKIPDADQKIFIGTFLKAEIIILQFIPIVLLSCWVPLMDYVTNDKYGKTNNQLFSILALCVPLAALINFLWTIAFVNGKLKTIMYITIAASVSNILFNVVLIPKFEGIGAAISYMASTLLQAGLYFRFTKNQFINVNLRCLIIPIVLAAFSVTVSSLMFKSGIFAALSSTLIYITLILVSGQLKLGTFIRHLKTIRTRE